MRLLKVCFRNCKIFKKDVVIDFTNSNSVRKSPSEREHLLKAFKLKSGIYTQVLIAFTGLNATGKTSILELLSVVTDVLFKKAGLNSPNVLPKLVKMVPMKETLDWEVFFSNEHTVYRLCSSIALKVMDSEPDREMRFIYKEEQLQEKPLSSVTRKTLFDFDGVKAIVRSAIASQELYLQEDASLASKFKEATETVRTLGAETNINIANFLGTPPVEILNVFDPNIERLNIRPGENGKRVTELKFKHNDWAQYGGDPLGLLNFLSSGTIKGLTYGPSIIRVLKTGGYLFMDELENHFNRKIIEWILELFTDTKTNPHGACLIFSTHYPELLDCVPRIDNIYITRRDSEGYCECVRFSDNIDRNELSRSRIILENILGGTVPRFHDLKHAKEMVEQAVGKGE
ncbi:MAG: ATPase-AAA-core domain-containing protein [Succiniclasticum sp.]|jgi:AAA15 family ATPase/GTPase